MLNPVIGVINTANSMGGEKGQKKSAKLMGEFNEQRKWVRELFHNSEDHVLNINLCVTFLKPFTSTGIQRLKIGLFYKRSSASLMLSGLFKMS